MRHEEFFAKHLIAALVLIGTMLGTAAVASAEVKAVAEERNGVVEVEAESFAAQHKDDMRRWYVVRAGHTEPDAQPDGDPSHADAASGGAYIEVLPDTRRTHDDKLVAGENLANEPGRMAVIDYPIHFSTAGRYYVWVRAYSTGTEDNGIHVGLDGTWPPSGQRLQWTAKNKWYWDSKQRTQEVHTGVPGRIWLDIDKPGMHVISFSMREDGFEMDKFLLTQDKSFVRPDEGVPSKAGPGKPGDEFGLREQTSLACCRASVAPCAEFEMRTNS